MSLVYRHGDEHRDRKDAGSLKETDNTVNVKCFRLLLIAHQCKDTHE